MAPQRVEDFALEAQGVVQEQIFLADQAFAGGERVDEGAVVEMRENTLEEMLLVDGLDQASLQLFGGERLDQVVVGRQFCDGDHIVIAAFGGDDHIHRG